jgi:hypothetical protein
MLIKSAAMKTTNSEFHFAERVAAQGFAIISGVLDETETAAFFISSTLPPQVWATVWSWP